MPRKSDGGMKEVIIYHPETDADKAAAVAIARRAGMTIIEETLEHHNAEDLSDYHVLDEAIDLIDMLGIRESIAENSPAPALVPAAS